MCFAVCNEKTNEANRQIAKTKHTNKSQKKEGTRRVFYEKQRKINCHHKTTYVTKKS